MEDQVVSSPHHGNISTLSQKPSDAKTDVPTSTQFSQCQMKPVTTSDQGMKMHEEASTLKEENVRLTQEKENLIIDLEECKMELFKRMPPNQISDDSIQKAMEQVRGSIDSFVYETMGDAADDALYSLCLRKQRKQRQKQKRRKARNSLSTFIENEDISVWGPYECSNFYILSVIVQWILDEHVFKVPYPLGITRAHISIMKELEEGMYLVSHGQKQERADIWRSETLTALTALRENESRLEEASRKICSSLADIFSPWLLKAGPFIKAEGRFRQEILDPAIRLHQDLKTSSHQYETRHIKIFDRLSQRQMLKGWELKDADTWQRVRGEKEVGRALYCLHPQIARFPIEGATPIVVAKPVLVVASQKRENTLNRCGLKDSPLSGTTVIPPAFEHSPSTNTTISPSKYESPVTVNFVDEDSMSSDSDSTTDSGSRQLKFHGSRASTHPITQKHEYPYGSFQRRLSVPAESSHGREDRQGHFIYYPEGDGQPSGWPAEGRDDQLYAQGYTSSQALYTYSPAEAARHLPRRTSRDRSGGRNSPRRSANENPQPPFTPSTPVPGTPLVRSRGFKKKSFSWQR